MGTQTKGTGEDRKTRKKRQTDIQTVREGKREHRLNTEMGKLPKEWCVFLSLMSFPTLPMGEAMGKEMGKAMKRRV